MAGASSRGLLAADLVDIGADRVVGPSGGPAAITTGGE